MNLRKAHREARQKHIKDGGCAIIVLSGNYRQFEEWLRQNVEMPNIGKYIYAGSADKLRGVRASGVVKVGTFANRDDYIEVREVALRRVHYGDSDDV